MNLRLGGKAAAITAAVALGGAGVHVAAQSPASASTFSETYSCNVPIAGTETVTANGSLTASPNPAISGSTVNFDLNISSISLTSPVTINSWSATADIAGSGAESSSFTVSGSGGSIPANSAISNLDLTGSWTPSASGPDSFTVGDVTIKANVTLLGTQTVTCTPTGTAPVAETLSVS
jgi:hypothetical protein